MVDYQTIKEETMQIKYRTIIRDGKVVEEQYFENICCEDMGKALLNQETIFAKPNVKAYWIYCPFCKAEIEY